MTPSLEPLYRRYNAACNAHRFDRLGEFVAGDVEVNGAFQGLPAYVRGSRRSSRRSPTTAGI